MDGMQLYLEVGARPLVLSTTIGRFHIICDAMSPYASFFSIGEGTATQLTVLMVLLIAL